MIRYLYLLCFFLQIYANEYVLISSFSLYTHVLFDSVYMKCSEKTKISGCLGLGVGTGINRMRDLFGVMEVFSNLILVMVA